MIKGRITINKKKIIFIIIILIFINTAFLLLFFASKLGEVMLLAAEKELKEISTMIIVNNISRENLPKVSVDDIIVANKNANDEITDIDFKLDLAYDMFFDLKAKVDNEIFNVKKGIIPTNASIINDNLIIKVPFYAFTDNPLLMNLGPKLHFKVNMIETSRGSITTEVSAYGINTVLIDCYLNLTITQSIILPTGREVVSLEFNLLLASKVVQGKVPSLYTGKYQANSPIFNLD